MTRTRHGRRSLPAAFALASGVMFASATPPLDFYAGILMGLLGLALTMRWPFSISTAAVSASGAQNPFREGAVRGWLFGFGANVVALRFVPEVVVRFTDLPSIAAWTALFLLSGAQAIPWAVGGIAMRGFAESPRVALPGWLSFGIGSFLATFVPSIFPWTPAGGLARWPWLLQLAEFVGERGVTFLLASTLGLFAEALVLARRIGDASARRSLTLAGMGAAISIAMIGAGVLRSRSVAERRAASPHVKIALLQPGFEASDRWDPARATMMLDRLTTLTKSAEARGAALSVWPESSYPFTIPHLLRRSPSGERAILQPGIHGPVLTGVYMSSGHGLGYNSAVLATEDGAISEPYDKRHLLWFGETVPFADSFPVLRRIFSRGTGLVSGTTSPVFHAGPIRAAVLNCYEDTLPQAGREAMEGHPNVLVNITNDAWFAGSAEGELHLRLATLRAIEARRDLVRAVNQGPTTHVDATGAIEARYDAPFPASVPVSPALLEGPPTLFVRFGDTPLVLLLTGVVGAQLIARRRRRSRTPQNTASVRSRRKDAQPVPEPVAETTGSRAH